MKIELTDYWDIWGNEEEGWEVNNIARNEYTTRKFDIWDRKKVLQWLKRIEYLQKRVRRDMLEWEETDQGFILYQASNGIPLCEIRLLEEGKL